MQSTLLHTSRCKIKKPPDKDGFFVIRHMDLRFDYTVCAIFIASVTCPFGDNWCAS